MNQLCTRQRQLGNSNVRSFDDLKRVAESTLEGPHGSVPQLELHDLLSEAVDHADQTVGTCTYRP